MDLSEFAYGVDTPVAGTGSSAAPTAGTTVASITSGSLPAGTYDVCVITRNSPAATADETAALANNMELRAGPTVLINRLGSDRAPGHSEEVMDVKLDGSVGLLIVATASASANTIYRALIVATRNA